MACGSHASFLAEDELVVDRAAHATGQCVRSRLYSSIPRRDRWGEAWGTAVDVTNSRHEPHNSDTMGVRRSVVISENHLLYRAIPVGGPPGARTRNLRIKSPQLCQLS